MGRAASPSESGLARALFPQARLRVLSLLYGQPERQFYASEIIRLAGSGSGAVQRELIKLTKAGILATTASGNRKVYHVNRQSPIFEEIQALILKTEGLVGPLRKALKPYSSKIQVAFVYGSVAKGTDTANSDIDLMIIGKDLSYSEVYSALQKAEKVLLRPVNPNLMDVGEWRSKLAHKNPFLTKIAQGRNLFIIGTKDELQAIR